ncbi:MBL fold metallo-hydrolase [Streptomyces sp. NPDC048442]|uniref:MBL fold metallo-hydrolase n=1 Tax=Streptomyces sp. NPDC048442 TaxID=3154823 RepID=UPI003422727E
MDRRAVALFDDFEPGANPLPQVGDMAAIDTAAPGAEITTVVNSQGNGDHTWGNQLIPDAEFITSVSSGANLCHEMSPVQLTALSQSPPTTPVAAYAAEHFGMVGFAGLGLGHSHGDVAVHVPDDGVVFAGDALFNGAHMVVWSPSLRACITACDTLLDTGAAVFVPGHGKITDRSGVTAIRDLLARTFDASAALATAGMDLHEATRHGAGSSWWDPHPPRAAVHCRGRRLPGRRSRGRPPQGRFRLSKAWPRWPPSPRVGTAEERQRPRRRRPFSPHPQLATQ